LEKIILLILKKKIAINNNRETPVKNPVSANISR
jgi:hypothetical protein